MPLDYSPRESDVCSRLAEGWAETKSKEAIDMKKCYLVIELNNKPHPTIIGLYRTRTAAEIAAYSTASAWRNIIELPLQD